MIGVKFRLISISDKFTVYTSHCDTITCPLWKLAWMRVLLRESQKSIEHATRLIPSKSVGSLWDFRVVGLGPGLLCDWSEGHNVIFHFI